LRDLGPDPGFVSDALLGIVSQRLVRKVCSHCAESYTPTDMDLRILGLPRSHAKPEAWRQGRGCAKCFHSGYFGREAIVELLNIDQPLRRLIYEGTMTQLHHYIDESSFDSFRLAAIEKVTTGVTTLTEVLRVIPNSALHYTPATESLATPAIERSESSNGNKDTAQISA
jgi:type II secretory ATPase GspE/PulE/Tfp pilus assembly ATPase PilB-like protein